MNEANTAELHLVEHSLRFKMDKRQKLESQLRPIAEQIVKISEEIDVLENRKYLILSDKVELET